MPPFGSLLVVAGRRSLSGIHLLTGTLAASLGTEAVALHAPQPKIAALLFFLLRCVSLTAGDAKAAGYHGDQWSFWLGARGPRIHDRMS